MGRRIAYCADGTWDTTASDTNVYRISKAIVAMAGEQFSFYDDGVGSDGTPIEKLLGGAFGDGLFQKIKDGYSSISSIYEAGDEIFLFGFSRGAYTARSLAGMIAACGLPTKNPDSNLVDAAFQAYRNKDQRPAILATLGAYRLVEATLTMVGVWDTVGALGIPAIFGAVSPLLYGFLDTSLSPQISNAYHAVAIDERRQEFPATLWTSAPAPAQTLEQVYFCGVHCDVGGGYPDDAGTGTALSDITFSWLMAKACALGLVFDAGVLSAYPSPIDQKDALDTKHESWSPLWLFPKPRVIAPDATLANSVTVRCQTDSTYRPGNLSLVNGVPGATYGTEVVVA
ncbi:MAG: DUF2235 domain-containing protein [Steroidobacteraceae bacterium]